MAEIDLTPDGATSEEESQVFDDIQAAVESVAADNGEELGSTDETPPETPTEPGPDGSASDENGPAPETTEEVPSSDDEDAPADDGDASTSESSAETAELEARRAIDEFGATYGFTPEQTAEINSIEELKAAARLLDQSRTNDRQRAQYQQQQQEAYRQQQAQQQAQYPPQQQPPSQGQPQQQPGQTYDQFIQQLRDEEYGEPMIGAIEAIHAENQQLRQIAANSQEVSNRALDTIRSRDEQHARAMQDQYDNNFVEFLDTLGHPELFGESGKSPTEEQKLNARAAYDDTIQVQQTLAAEGRPMRLSAAIVERGCRNRFASQIDQKSAKEKTRRVKKQAGQIMGASGNQPAAEDEDAPRTGDVDTDPVLQSFLRKLRTENA